MCEEEKERREAGVYSRRRVLFLTGVAAALPLISPLGRAKAADAALRINVFDQFAPLSFKEGGAITGILPDLLNEVLQKRMGHPISFQGMPWLRAQEGVKDGDADAFCTTPTDKRREYAVFGQEPILTSGTAVFFAKSNPRAEEIRNISTIDDLPKFSQGDYSGNGFAETTFKGLKIEWANSLDQVMKKIALGRNDIFVGTDVVGRWTVKQSGLSDQIVNFNVDFAPPSNFNLGIRKSLSGHEQVIQRYDEIVKQAKSDGTLAGIITRYA